MRDLINVVDGDEGLIHIKLRLAGRSEMEAGRHNLELKWHRPDGSIVNHVEGFVVRENPMPGMIPQRDIGRLVKATKNRLASRKKEKHGRRTRPTQRRRRPR